MVKKKSNNKSKEDLNNVMLIIILIIATSAILAAMIAGNIIDVANQFAYLSGIIGYIVYYYFLSQTIIDKNSNSLYFFIGFLILLINIIIQSFTSFIWVNLFISAVPLLYVLYLKILLNIFYRDYQNIPKKPIIVYGSKFGKAYFKGDTEGYKPTMKEKLFSVTLFFGFILIFFGIIFTIKNLQK